MRLNFGSIVASLNPRVGVNLDGETGDPSSPLHAVPIREPQPPDPFIEPTFAGGGPFEWLDGPEIEHRPAILLIRAAAAVGKSTLARALADRCSGLLWNIGAVRVGNGTLDGIMTRAYGYRAPSEISAALRSGSLTVVIDALDEALMRSSHNLAVESLATDLRALLGDSATELVTREATSSPDGSKRGKGFSIVVLGRPSSIELLELALDEVGLSCTVLDVDYFEVGSSVELIVQYRSRLRTQSKSGADSRPVDPELVTEAAYRILSRLERELVGGDEDELVQGKTAFKEPSGEFLGYAPVLMAIAESLSVDAAEFDRVVSEMLDLDSSSMWSIVMSICRSILRREQRKIVAGITTRLGGVVGPVPPAVVEDLCSPEMQLRFILEGSVDLTSSLESLPEMLSDEQVKEIRSAFTSFIEEHPFLKENSFSRDVPHTDDRFKHAVFRDYCYALLCRREVRLGDAGELSLLRRSMALDNPMLSRFCLAAANSEGSGSSSAVDSEFIPIFLSSLQADRRTHVSSLLIRESDSGELKDRPDRLLELVLNENEALSVGVSSGDVSGHLTLRQDDELVIWDRLTGVVVDTPSVDISLSTRGNSQGQPDEFLIFDGSAISCRNLAVEPSSILLVPQAQGSQDDESSDEPMGCVIQVRGQITSMLASVHAELVPLSLYSPQVPGYPLLQHHRGNPLVHRNRELEEPARLLRQLVTNFGRAPANKGRGLVVYANAVDQALSSGRIDREFFGFALQWGLVAREGDLYRLMFKEFDIPFNLARLGDYRNSDALYRFLESFAQSSSG